MDHWLARVSVAAGVLNSIAVATSSMLELPIAWTTAFSISGCVALLAAIVFQTHALRRHQPLVNEKNRMIGQLQQRLEAAESTIAKRCEQLQAQAVELSNLSSSELRFKRLSNALPILLEAITELRQHLAPAAVSACLAGDVDDFVVDGTSKLLTALRNGLRLVSPQNGDHEVTCAAHIGYTSVSSAYAAGTPTHRKTIERGYVRSSHSLAGLVRHYPSPLAGDSLEDRPPVHNGETHSAAGWTGNISGSIQSFLCHPIVMTDGKDEATIGVLQVDSPVRAAFPPEAAVLLEPVADGIGILFQIGSLATRLEKSAKPSIDVISPPPI